ncbi:MAG TPA: hypothetical protein EYP09_08230 [Anaerolineae bacterium]|nr:hypothetical protein [Anaerolineae bacterium]
MEVVKSRFYVLVCTSRGPQYYSLEARGGEEALEELKRAWERGYGEGKFEEMVRRVSVHEGICPQLEFD